MFIIANAGLAWNCLSEAASYVEFCYENNIDYVNFQWTDNPKLPQLTRGEWYALKRYADSLAVFFMCAPENLETAKILIDWKVTIKVNPDLAIQEYWIDFDGNFSKALSFPEQIKKILREDYNNGYEFILVSDGYGENEYTNMYCVAARPCFARYVDFDILREHVDIGHYVGFSDYTILRDYQWCERAVKTGINYYEKNVNFGWNDNNKDISLDREKFLIFKDNLCLAEKNIRKPTRMGTITGVK